jgi:hypothetical protein
LLGIRAISPVLLRDRPRSISREARLLRQPGGFEGFGAVGGLVDVGDFAVADFPVVIDADLDLDLDPLPAPSAYSQMPERRSQIISPPASPRLLA